MTELQTDRPVKRQTATIYRGRPLMVELHTGYMTFREKGKQTRFTLDYRAAYDLAQKLEARDRLAQKQAAKKAKTRNKLW